MPHLKPLYTDVQILCLWTFVVGNQLTLHCKISDNKNKSKGTAHLWSYKYLSPGQRARGGDERRQRGQPEDLRKGEHIAGYHKFQRIARGTKVEKYGCAHTELTRFPSDCVGAYFIYSRALPLLGKNC